MYTFGKSSTEKLLTCRNELQVVAHEAIKLVDFSIIHGYRTQEQQDLIYAQGLSKAKYPNSKHNTNPSDAFDFMPYPVDWKDTKQFSYIAGIIVGIGLAKGIIIYNTEPCNSFWRACNSSNNSSNRNSIVIAST